MKQLALTLIGPDGEPIKILAPSGIPSDGLNIAQTITGNAVNIFFAIGVLLALFYLIYGGIQWTMSTGDKQKVAAARNRIMYAIFGLVIIFFAIFFVNIILYFFGHDKI